MPSQRSRKTNGKVIFYMATKLSEEFTNSLSLIFFFFCTERLIQMTICSIRVYKLKNEIKGIPLHKMTGKIPILLGIAGKFPEQKPSIHL